MDKSVIPQFSEVENDAAPSNAVAGRIQQFIQEWRKISHDPSMLSAIEGYSLEFLCATFSVETTTANNFLISGGTEC